ncbi:MAG: type II secretion system protein [Planctomycetota bacterium]
MFKRKPSGFTLVEILTVIVIIGILMGLAIPAITAALRTANEAAIRNDINVLSQAVESYKLEHGEYPPDFTDWAAVESHFRSAFPNIDNNELRILAQFTHYDASQARMDSSTPGPADPRANPAFDHHPHALDRAEALVFCLGGYSSEKNRPFTGQGGPLVLRSGVTLPALPAPDDYLLFQYNNERDTGFFDFDITQMSVALVTPSGAPPFAYSDDEGIDIGMTATNALGVTFHTDPFPVYRAPKSELPLVYFHSRDYDLAWGAGIATSWNPSSSLPNSHHWQNVYLPAGATPEATGVARPYAANVLDTTPPSVIEGNSVVGPVLEFAENDKFQIVSAGLDEHFGGILFDTWGASAAGIPVFPSGQYYNPFVAFTPPGPYGTVSEVNKYQDDLCLAQQYGLPAVYRVDNQLDNITNFSTRTLEGDLP